MKVAIPGHPGSSAARCADACGAAGDQVVRAGPAPAGHGRRDRAGIRGGRRRPGARRALDRRRRGRAPGRRAGRRPPLDGGPQAEAAGQPGRTAPGRWSRADGRRMARPPARAAVRLGDRLVRRHRRPGGRRVRAAGHRVPGRPGPRLGGGGATRAATLASGSSTCAAGVVLSRRGGMLGRLLPLFRLGLGARIGPGHAVHQLDRAGRPGPGDPVPARPRRGRPGRSTSPRPTPVTNAEFTAALARALHRPALLGLPAPVLSAALGGVTGDLLTSARVAPAAAGRGLPVQPTRSWPGRWPRNSAPRAPPRDRGWRGSSPAGRPGTR